MLYKLKENKLESIAFEDFGSIGRKEKELESIFAQNLEMIYGEYGILFPISQERQGQGQPDLCALDKEGNLIIFELNVAMYRRVLPTRLCGIRKFMDRSHMMT